MIKLKDITFSYTGSAPFILNGADMEVKKGEYISVVGDNGAGKTTLIKILLKFIKPVGGRVEISAERIGFVPQKKENTSFPITVYEMLNSYRKVLKVKDRSTITSSLEAVGLTGVEKKLIGNLSGGQYQKLLIARALLGSPDLLILDEPSTGIDIHSQKEIYALLKRLNKEKGITIISVEHNLLAARENSTLIYHLVSGRGHMCTPEHYVEEFMEDKGESADV